MINDNMGLVPLWNFAKVRPGVYRSAQPDQPFAFDWMADHGFTLVIDCRETGAKDDALDSDGRCTVYHLRVHDDQAPRLADIREALAMIRQNDGKTLIHCEHGHGRTSTMSAAVRMAFDGLTAEQAIAEEAATFGYQFRNACQVQALHDLEATL